MGRLGQCTKGSRNRARPVSYILQETVPRALRTGCLHALNRDRCVTRVVFDRDESVIFSYNELGSLFGVAPRMNDAGSSISLRDPRDAARHLDWSLQAAALMLGPANMPGRSSRPPVSRRAQSGHTRIIPGSFSLFRRRPPRWSPRSSHRAGRCSAALPPKSPPEIPAPSGTPKSSLAPRAAWPRPESHDNRPVFRVFLRQRRPQDWSRRWKRSVVPERAGGIGSGACREATRMRIWMAFLSPRLNHKLRINLCLSTL